jgi:hypothetical protein
MADVDRLATLPEFKEWLVALELANQGFLT